MNCAADRWCISKRKPHEQTFKFQHNIIEDDLEYKRKDDILLSATAYSVNKIELQTGTTKDGHKKTSHERLSVWVAYRNGGLVSEVKKSGARAEFPVTETGESRTLYFWNVTDPQKLIDLAAAELKKYYYTGLKRKVYNCFWASLCTPG
jgi:hypothetical protein